MRASISPSRVRIGSGLNGTGTFPKEEDGIVGVFEFILGPFKAIMLIVKQRTRVQEHIIVRKRMLIRAMGGRKILGKIRERDGNETFSLSS
jgi:rRNA processing protein Gar1